MFTHLCTIRKYMMPSYYHFQFNNPEFEIAILHMDSIELDSTVLFPSEIVHEQLRSNTKRKKEYLGARYLRNSLNINSPILYHPNGKPYFSDIELSLSISHTSTQIALAFAKFPIGIDIEDRSWLVDYGENIYTIQGSSSNYDENVEIFKSMGVEKFDFILNEFLKFSVIAHLHCNNFDSIGLNGFPKTIELTFVNANYANTKELVTALPLPGLDSPTAKNREDYVIKF